jgi:hypothetical protein
MHTEKSRKASTQLLTATGTYGVAFNDGDKSTHVLLKDIELAFVVGAKVFAMFDDDKCYKSIISAVNRDSTYSVAFDDGDKSKSVLLKDIKLNGIPD